jgi:hypothetical protein
VADARSHGHSECEALGFALTKVSISQKNMERSPFSIFLESWRRQSERASRIHENENKAGRQKQRPRQRKRQSDSEIEKE